MQIFEYSNGVELVDSNERETVDVTPVLRSLEPRAIACSRCWHHLQRGDLPELITDEAMDLFSHYGVPALPHNLGHRAPRMSYHLKDFVSCCSVPISSQDCRGAISTRS